MPARSPKSEDWTQTFRNILELERSNGFNDRAVIGGLDSFVRLGTESMASYTGKSSEARQLLRPGYARMDGPQRAQWVEQWLTLLDEGQPPAFEESGSAESGSNVPEAKPGSARPRVTSRSPRKASAAAAPPAEIGLDSPVTQLKQVTRRLPDQLARLDINTVRDLIYHFPTRHIDYTRTAKISELWPGQDITVTGRISEARERALGRRRRKATEAVLTDETGSVKITWFGQGYLARSLKPGTRIAVSGKVDAFQNRPVFESPEYDIIRPGQASRKHREARTGLSAHPGPRRTYPARPHLAGAQ